MQKLSWKLADGRPKNRIETSKADGGDWQLGVNTVGCQAPAKMELSNLSVEAARSNKAAGAQVNGCGDLRV
jgi:hypothetical protein